MLVPRRRCCGWPSRSCRACTCGPADHRDPHHQPAAGHRDAAGHLRGDVRGRGLQGGRGGASRPRLPAAGANPAGRAGAALASPREAPLSALCDGDVEEHDTTEWANSQDTELQYRFTDLLTRTVQGSYPDLRWHNERRHVHLRPSTDLTPRKAGKGPGSRGRTVFGPHYAQVRPRTG
jgi:hypothetical protein